MPRVGLGFDIHRTDDGRPLYLAGLHIEGEPGLAGHSDADVVLHAVIDALLGAAGLDDIGTHFPPSDPAFADVSSVELLNRTLAMLKESFLAVQQIDVNIIAEKPKLGDRKKHLRANLARLLELDTRFVAVKARTMEGLGPIGAAQAIAAQAIAVLEEIA